MKRIIDTPEGGLDSLLGKRVMVRASYFYDGILVGVNEKSLILKDPTVVYETGPHIKAPDWANAEKLGTPELFIMLRAIETIYPLD